MLGIPQPLVVETQPIVPSLQVPLPTQKRLPGGEIISLKSLPLFLFILFVLQLLLILGYLFMFPSVFSYFIYLFSFMQLSISVGNDWLQVLLVIYVVSILLSLPFLFNKKLFIVITGIVSFVTLYFLQFVVPMLKIERDYYLKSLVGVPAVNLFKEVTPNSLFISCVFLFVLCLGLTLAALAVSYLNLMRSKIALVIFAILSIVALGAGMFFVLRLRTVSQLATFGVIQTRADTGKKCTQLKPMLKNSEKWRTFYNQTCAPVWITKDLDFVGPVNALLYTIDFKDIQGSDSVLRIYLDDHEIAKREQKEVQVGENKLVDYFETLPAGKHELFILLKPKAYISSVMDVKNVCTAYDPTMSCKTKECSCGE